jgi:hypothetical protein
VGRGGGGGGFESGSVGGSVDGWVGRVCVWLDGHWVRRWLTHTHTHTHKQTHTQTNTQTNTQTRVESELHLQWALQSSTSIVGMPEMRSSSSNSSKRDSNARGMKLHRPLQNDSTWERIPFESICATWRDDVGGCEWMGVFGGW